MGFKKLIKNTEIRKFSYGKSQILVGIAESFNHFIVSVLNYIGFLQTHIKKKGKQRRTWLIIIPMSTCIVQKKVLPRKYEITKLAQRHS